VAILLVGALSRWVNHLEDQDFEQPRTRVLLKALRTNLKLAIDYGLQHSQSELIASFLQTLIMSEGEKWVHSQTNNVAIALRASDGKPVRSAEDAVRSFATKELGKAHGAIAALEDYVANATADLIMLAAWSCVMDLFAADSIPSYYFARDDRVYKAFADRLVKFRGTINKLAGKKLKWQLRVIETLLDGRATTYRSKVEMLAIQLDEPLVS